MLAFILLGLLGGMKLDEYLHTDNSIYTMIGSFLGCTASIIYVIRKLPKDS